MAKRSTLQKLAWKPLIGKHSRLPVLLRFSVRYAYKRIRLKTRGPRMDCRTCTYKSEAFKQLTHEQMLRVSGQHTELAFKHGELLSKQGMLMSHVIYVLDGFVKLYLEGEDEVTTIGIAKPGAYIGIQMLYGRAVTPFSIEALTDARVCMIGIDVFREMIVENSGFARGIIEMLNDELTRSYGRIFSLTKKHVNARFAELLLYLKNMVYRSNPFELTISRKELADLISTSPETVSRLLGEFKKDGLIKVKGHTIKLADTKRLRTIRK